MSRKQTQRLSNNATFITIKITEKFINAFIDSGATQCFASSNIKLDWKKIKETIKS